ncbi:MAG TPA: ABC transporter ATP-binding protein [Gemmataceae bacterium]|nr:ABC transporter ATP-binding protein [Gemmataceae bacterium]
MDRQAERHAFTRARKYLNYNAAAKWAALLAGAGTALIYVALLVLLGLFADLMIHRGAIPSYAELTPAEQARFQDFWQGLPTERQQQLLQGVGLPDPAAADLAADADRGFDQLSPPRQALLWRAYLSRMLRDRVSGNAGAIILPSYRELPTQEQEAFARFWKEWPARGSTMSQDLQLNQDLIGELDRPGVDVRQLPPARQELAWNVYLLDRLKHMREGAGDKAVEYVDPRSDYVQQRALAEAAENPPAPGAEGDPLANRGILSLVVRSDLRNDLLGPNPSVLSRLNPFQAASPVLGWVARWNTLLWRHGDVWELTELLGLAILLGVLSGLLTFFMQDMAARATTEAATRLRRAVYHHTFRLGTLAFRALGPGEAVSIFTRHVEAVHDALFLSITVLFRQPIKFALLLILALVIHPPLALAFLLFAVVIYLVGMQVSAAVQRQSRAAVSRAAEQLTLIRESLMLMRLVKCYLMELFNQSRVERQLARYASSQLRRYRGEAFYRALLIFLGLLATACLLFVAGLIVLHDQLTVPGFLVLATALVSLYWPLQSWLETRRLMRRGREAAVILFQFLDRPGEVGQMVGAEFLAPLSRDLEFDNVSLREPGSGRMLLQDVSLRIKAGQRVALVGAEELEKHALVYLLPRFLDPTSGEIRIDGHNLRYVTLDSLRAQIAVVLQHNLVFHDTVANNIGCGDPGYTLPQIIEAAKVAHAHHFIQRLPKGYETAIGELGHSLNLGEQFRIALARAILRDPALLIIEEPEKQLDEDVKGLLDDTFARLLPGRTAIFLPHRISTLKSCDQVFLLHKGRLEAVGDHRGLLAQNALYRHLHYLEFSEMAEQV